MSGTVETPHEYAPDSMYMFEVAIPDGMTHLQAWFKKSCQNCKAEVTYRGKFEILTRSVAEGRLDDFFLNDASQITIQ